MVNRRRLVPSRVIGFAILAVPALLALGCMVVKTSPEGSPEEPMVVRNEMSIASSSPASRRMRAIVAFVRFRDDDELAGGCLTRAKREWNDLNSLPAIAHDILARSPEPPFTDSSLTAYFYQQSRKRFLIDGQTYPRLLVTEREESAYGRGSSGVLDRGAVTQEVLRRMDDDPSFDLGDFDADEDGRIDYLFIVLRRLNHLELVSGGAPAVAHLGYTSPLAELGSAKDIGSPVAGSYVIYRSAGIIIPHLDLIRLMAHEFGHYLWRGPELSGGHIQYIGGDFGVPANGARRLGYALMVGRLSLNREQDVIDTRGDMVISAFERDVLGEGWIDCPVLSSSRTVALGDLYSTSDCRRIIVPGRSATRTLYITNRQRIGYFDRLQFNPCQSSYHGLMTTGLLVQIREGRRLAVAAADNTLELSVDTSAYTGDLFGPAYKTQLTPWTRPNISGYSKYPSDFVIEPGSWQGLDNIRSSGPDGEVSFEYVADVRARPIIREDSWMGAETSGTRFRADIVVKQRAELTISAGTVIRLVQGADLIVEEAGTLKIESGARVELGLESSVVARGTIVRPEGGEDPFVRIE